MLLRSFSVYTLMKFSVTLKKTADFQEVYHTGRSVADGNLVLYGRRNQLSVNRLGISVSKKYGNSVKRHLFRRRILAIYESHEDTLIKGVDIVVIARNTAADRSFSDLKISFDKLVRRSGFVVTE